MDALRAGSVDAVSVVLLMTENRYLGDSKDLYRVPEPARG